RHPQDLDGKGARLMVEVMTRKLLSAAEVDAYHRDGQLTPSHRLPADLMGRMTRAIEHLIAANADIRPEQLVGAHVARSQAPGTHRDGLMAHEFTDRPGLALNQGLVDPVDETAARDVVLEPGQVSLHDALVVHGSNANRSGQRRCGYAIRYMPATSHFDRTIP